MPLPIVSIPSMVMHCFPDPPGVIPGSERQAEVRLMHTGMQKGGPVGGWFIIRDTARDPTANGERGRTSRREGQEHSQMPAWLVVSQFALGPLSCVMERNHHLVFILLRVSPLSRLPRACWHVGPHVMSPPTPGSGE